MILVLSGTAPDTLLLMLDILRWPLLVFFATSGVVGVVYGFISPEWPLTQLSVGLTGADMTDMT